MFTTAVRGLLAHRRRLLRTSLAVLLGVAFLAGTLVLGDTMRSGFSTVFAERYAGTDVLVQGATTFGSESTEQRRPVPTEVVERLAATPGVARAVGVVEGLAQVTGRDGRPVGGTGPPTVGTNWVDDPDLNPMQIVAGQAPRADDEVVVDRGTARAGDLSVGDTTVVRTPAPTPVTVAGIAAFGTQDSAGGAGLTAFTDAAARRLLLGDDPGWTSVVVVGDAGVAPATLEGRVESVLPDGFEALTGDQARARAEQAIGDDFLDMLETFLLVFTGVALLVAAFSIHNTFSVVLAQRSREAALLRAVGATRAQVLAAIALEALVIGVAAAVGGAAAGLGLAALLRRAMAGMGVDLPGSLTVEWTSLAVAGLVGLVVTLVAGIVPAARAARIAPLAALREASVDHGGTSRGRTLAGVALTATGVGLVLWAALATTSPGLGVVGAGALCCVVGAVVVGPALARPAAAALSVPLGAMRGATGRLAGGNARRNPTRTAGTASALLVGVAVVALFTGVAASLTTMVRDAVVGSVRSDLLVVDTGFSGSGLDAGLAVALEEMPEVRSAVALGYGPALVDGREEELTVTDPRPLAAGLDTELRQGSLAELAPDELAVVASTAQERGWRLGSVVPVTFVDGSTVPLRIGAVYGREQLAGPIVIPRSTWDSHGAREVVAVTAVTLADGVDEERGTAAVRRVTERFGAPAPQTRQEYADSTAGRINTMLGVVYVLLALSIVIALMGISNTLALSLHERTRELGLLRAVGQTRRQLRSMVRWESVLIALLGTVGGIAVGVFLSWGLVRTLVVEGSSLTGFTVPVSQLGLIAALGAAVGVVAAARPARRAARLDVLGAIAGE